MTSPTPLLAPIVAAVRAFPMRCPRPGRGGSASVGAMLLTLALAACDGAAPGMEGPSTGPVQVATSSGGAVAAAHPLAADAGAAMLAQGGNAVDAAVAAAFVLAVVEPSMSGIGGRAQILIRLPDGTYAGIDATTQAPATYDPDTAPQAGYGYPTVGVPGVPAGLLRALERYGSLDRATVMDEAIRLAEEGFELLPGEAARQASVAEQLAEFEGSRAIFLKADGSPYAAGERLVQPDLARTLRAIRDGGAAAFYTGAIAEQMAEDVAVNGGALTPASLAEYEALDAQVVTGSYRGFETVGLWLPSYGAITTLILNLMETMPLDALDEDDWGVAVAEAIRVGYLDRPSQRTPADAARLTSKAYALERAALMRTAQSATGPVAMASGSGAPDGHTTHLSTADGSGMMVALTQSLGPTMGSRVVTPGLGFVYAATLGGYLGRMEPGERADSHISPFMLAQDGTPVLALGAAGGGRIPTAIVAAISRMVDRGMALPEALAAPRIVASTPGMDAGGDVDAPTRLEVEIVEGLGFAPAVLDSFTSKGFEVETIERTGAFGRIHAVRWHPDLGVWEGVADPDWEGAVAVPVGAGAGADAGAGAGAGADANAGAGADAGADANAGAGADAGGR